MAGFDWVIPTILENFGVVFSLSEVVTGTEHVNLVIDTRICTCNHSWLLQSSAEATYHIN